MVFFSIGDWPMSVLRYTFRDSVCTKPLYVECIFCILLDIARQIILQTGTENWHLHLQGCKSAQFPSSLPRQNSIILEVRLVNLRVPTYCVHFHFLTFGDHKHHISIYLLASWSFSSKNCLFTPIYFYQNSFHFLINF